MRAGIALLAVIVIACAGDDGARDASHDARVLDCDGPMSLALEAATSGPNAGVPIATIVWTGNSCRLERDERDPDAVLVVFDTTGTWFDSGIVAAPGSDWRFVRSSLSESPGTLLMNVPRNNDVFVELETEDGASRVRIDFRVSTTTLTLLAMRQLR